MNEDYICAIISRYPQGIRGIDLRFSLQISTIEFREELTPLLVEKRMLCTPIHDFEHGIFSIKTKEVFPEPSRIVVSETLLQMHVVLQRYPNGLRASELACKISAETEDIERILLEQQGEGFVVEADMLEQVYRTCLTTPVERLVEGEKMLPALSSGRLLFRWGSLGVVIPYLVYVLLF